MIAVDSNLLVYAHRSELPQHVRALQILASLAESSRSWCITWANVHEFIRVVTDPKVFKPASTMAEAFRQIRAWQDSPGFRMLGETETHLTTLERLATSGGIVGAKIHDARIAAICIQHGVSELWTADRDFSYFPSLRTRNPLVG